MASRSSEVNFTKSYTLLFYDVSYGKLEWCGSNMVMDGEKFNDTFSRVTDILRQHIVRAMHRPCRGLYDISVFGIVYIKT